MNILRNTRIKKSRKSYNCDGDEQVDKHTDNDYEIEMGEKRKPCDRIKKGSPYEKQVQVIDGEIGAWRSCITCADIIHKHKFYDTEF